MKIETKPLSWFKPNDQNYRLHPKEQLQHIAASLEEFGQYKNVVVRPDGTVLAGHGVIDAAKANGLNSLAVVIFDGDDTASRKLMVADNELNRLAINDKDQLSQLLDAIQSDSGLIGTGYTDATFAELLDEVAGNPPDDLLEYGEGIAGNPVICPKCGHEFIPQSG